MLSGALSATFTKLPTDCEAEKAEVKLRLDRIAPSRPIAQIFLISCLLEGLSEGFAVYGRRSDDSLVAEGTAVLTPQVESAAMYAKGDRGPEAEIVPKVSDVAVFGLNANAALWGVEPYTVGCGSRI